MYAKNTCQLNECTLRTQLVCQLTSHAFTLRLKRLLEIHHSFHLCCHSLYCKLPWLFGPLKRRLSRELGSTGRGLSCITFGKWLLKKKLPEPAKTYDVVNCANRYPAVIKQAIISLQGMAEFKKLIPLSCGYICFINNI